MSLAASNPNIEGRQLTSLVFHGRNEPLDIESGNHESQCGRHGRHAYPKSFRYRIFAVQTGFFDLSNVTTSARSRLAFVTTPTIARALAFKNSESGRAFADLTLNPLGGSIAGAPLLVSDAVPAGQVLLIDASGFVANSDVVALDVTRQADLLMDSAPDSPPSAGTVPINLWQENKRGLRATRWWAARRLRDSAVAQITGASY